MNRLIAVVVGVLLSGACEESESTGGAEPLDPDVERPLTAKTPTLADLQTRSKAALSKSGLPNLVAPQPLQERMAELAKTSPDKILLVDSVSLTPELAASIKTFAGEVIICARLAKMDAAVASELAGFSGTALFLPRVAQIDPGAAKALAGWKGQHLMLTGLASVSEELAVALATFSGTTLGVGAAKMGPAAIVALKKFSGFLAISLSPPREMPKMDPAMRQKLVVAVKAINAGDVDGLRRFLDAGNPPDMHERGTTLLMYAADKKKPAIVKLLIEKGANVNATNSDGNGPLYHAMHRVLLPGAPTPDPVVVAEITRSLVVAGASARASPSSSRMYESPLVLAARSGSVELVELFLSKGADPAAGGALVAAINAGYPAIVKKLISAGANVNVPTPGPGESPIHRAVEAGATDITMFIYQSTMPGKKLDKGKLREIVKRRVAVLEAVLAAGANIEAPDDRGDTPLRAAINGGAVEILEVVLDAKPALDRVGTDGNPPLHYLAGLARLKEPDLVPLAKLMIKRGADTKAKNKAGKTAAEIAKGRGFGKLARALR